MSQFIGNLLTVGVTEHVEDQHDATHSRQLSTSRQFWKAAGTFESFGSVRDHLSNRLFTVVLQSTSMSVRAEHRRAFDALLSVVRAKEQSRYKMIRDRFEIDFLDCKSRTSKPTVNHRIQRRFFRHRPQTGSDQRLPSEVRRASFPGRLSLRNVEGKVSIEILRWLQATVVGKLTGFENVDVLSVRLLRCRSGQRQTTDNNYQCGVEQSFDAGRKSHGEVSRGKCFEAA